ncbi:MAG TPA: ABC transporter permease, partial [Ilumatobacteraceae bacterium]|nr:ABC transporter permease [Ilumatobacteraceae bacterium]
MLVPSRIHVGDSVGVWSALLLVLLLSALLGLGLYAAVYRPMRTASLLARVVASVGVMIVLQAAVVIQFGPESRLPRSILPNETIKLFGSAFPRDRFILAFVTAAVAVALWAVYRFTRFGLATRAASETERGAQLCGISPTSLALTNVIVVSVMAAAFGIVASPITGLDPTKFTLFIVPGLAAALVGRLRLISITAIAGLGIGMFQSELLFVSTQRWFPAWARSGVVDSVPFVLIAVALIASGHRLPVRGVLNEDSALTALRRGERPTVSLIWLAVATVALVVLRDQYRQALTVSIIGVVLMLSFVVLTGYLGQISLAQAAVAGVSGFAVAKLSTEHGIGFPLAPLLAALIATVAGCIIGISGLRVRGVQLAVVTLAGAVAIERLVFNNSELTGGVTGATVARPRLFGVNLSPLSATQRPSLAFGLLCVAVTALVIAAVLVIRGGAIGRRLIAARSNERAASSLGIDLVRVKM